MRCVSSSANMNNLSEFQRDLLYVIAGMDESYGLGIKEALEEYYDDEVHIGRLYPNLDKLVQNEFLNKGGLDDRTNLYTLTDHAKQQLQERREWENERVEWLS